MRAEEIVPECTKKLTEKREKNEKKRERKKNWEIC